MDKLTMNVTETAQALGISVTSCYNLVHRADFPAIRVGGRWVIPVENLKAWMTAQAEEKALCADIDQNVAQRA